jgi:hypothetical protein
MVGIFRSGKVKFPVPSSFAKREPPIAIFRSLFGHYFCYLCDVAKIAAAASTEDV